MTSEGGVDLRRVDCPEVASGKHVHLGSTVLAGYQRDMVVTQLTPLEDPPCYSESIAGATLARLPLTQGC